MDNFLTKAKSFIKGAIEFHLDSPSSLFKAFIATVLVQFSILGLVSIGTGNEVLDIPSLESTVQSAHYWWGLLGLFGSASLLFEKYIKDDLIVLILGYSSAILSLALLSYDFITTKPPIHTGGILSATAVVFLGGLLYGRVRKRWSVKRGMRP